MYYFTQPKTFIPNDEDLSQTTKTIQIIETFHFNPLKKSKPGEKNRIRYAIKPRVLGASRIRQCLAAKQIEAEEKKMFGGVAFMVNNNMAIGVTNKGDLLAHCLPEKWEWALEQPGCREMDFTGKPMKGFLFVDETAWGSDKGLTDWVDLSVELAFSKKAKKK